MTNQHKNFYEVIVGNVGAVHKGSVKAEAISVFKHQKGYSKANYGRAAGEAVTLYCNGEIVNGYDYVPGTEEEVKAPVGPRVKLWWKRKGAEHAFIVRRDGKPLVQTLQGNDFFRLQQFCEWFDIPLEVEKPNAD